MTAAGVDHDRRRFLGTAAMTIAAGHLGTFSTVNASDDGPRELAAIGSASAWLNSPPLTPSGLAGKVVVVDFCTYTCINWLRTLPYRRAWAQKYRQGLVLIGVHTPEFEFERVRQHHFGEGQYDWSEMTIQRLLAEVGVGRPGDGVVSVDASGLETAADWDNLRSLENYVGYEQAAHFVSPGGAERDRRGVYAAPAHLRLNQWALAGEWTMGRQATVLGSRNGRIVYRFHARDLHLVMGPPRHGNAVRFRVSLDGQPPGPAHGVDVDEGGKGMAEQRLYQLIRQPKPIADRRFEIEFLDGGVETFAFTFG